MFIVVHGYDIPSRETAYSFMFTQKFLSENQLLHNARPSKTCKIIFILHGTLNCNQTLNRIHILRVSEAVK